MADTCKKYLSKRSKLLEPERNCRNEGFLFVAGVDEVGRGPLAGPVVAAAVIFKNYEKIPQVFDSKALSSRQREELSAELIVHPQIVYAISEVAPEIIDKINILQATHLAMRQALTKLSLAPDFVLIDGNPVKSITYPNRSIVKGDAKSASIAAASIIAKVYRDNLMRNYDKIYPEYGFAENMGYGTKFHLEALKKYGATPIHRRSFAPVRELFNPNYQPELF